MMENKGNILIVTFTPPYPPVDGGKISVFGTVNYLRSHFNISLVFTTRGNEELINADTLSQLWPDVKINNVHLEDVSPKKNFVYFSKKWIKISLETVRKTIGKFNKKIIETHTTNLNNAVKFFPFYPIDSKLINHLEKLFGESFYDIIQVEHSLLLNIVHILPEKSKRIFVQIENRFTLLEDYFNKNNDNSLFARYIVNNAKFTELNLMKKYDYIFSLNKDDQQQLTQYIPKNNIFVAPFPILDSLHSKDDERNFEPKKLVFLGSQEHPPNEDAVKWFIETMYPNVNLKLYVTGKWEKGFVEKYPNVNFTGFIEDLSDLMRNSIVISPIRLGGGGIRAKVLQAMAMKSPLISTGLSCMGLESLEHGENVLIANSSEEFILAINRLEKDKSLCTHLISNGYTLIQKFYSEKAVGEIRKEIYNKILSEALV
jgi:glycosyltransferase involved in cell wall biosynthesis